MFGNLHQVCCGVASEPKTVCPSLDGGTRKELLEDVIPLCCYKDVPAIEIIAIFNWSVK